jgi:hypothetical protein
MKVQTVLARLPLLYRSIFDVLDFGERIKTEKVLYLVELESPKLGINAQVRRLLPKRLDLNRMLAR